MKKIIVPTDFSYASKDALAYAVRIAPLLEASIEVVHIYSGTFDNKQPYLLHSGMTRAESLKTDLQEFSTFEGEDGVAIQQEISISTQVISGFIERELVKLSKAPNTLMMVMGKTGKNISNTRLFGSIAKEVSTKAHCPVLLVPKKEQYTGINNILFASDYENIDQVTLKKTVDFSAYFKSAMHFVHITEVGSQDEYYKLIKEKIFNFLFQDRDPSFAFNLLNIKYPNIIDGLNLYIKENKIDLLIMVSHQRDFLSKIFLKSTTKEMVDYSDVPILVFHK